MLQQEYINGNDVKSKGFFTKDRILYFLDWPNLLCAAILCITWVASKYTPLQKLYVPPEDDLSNYPRAKKDQVNFELMVTIIIIGSFVFYWAIYFISLKAPKIMRKFNPMTAFYIGLAIFAFNNTTTNLFKSYVGRARPDMYAYCGYNSTTTCDIDEEFKSFPSGHSSGAMSGLLYPCLFLQKLVKTRYMLWTIVCFIFPALAIYVGCTRIRDFRHHFDDVLAGLCLGAFCTVIVWWRVRKTIFPKDKGDKTSQSLLLA
ncbi:PAP2 superfamily protein [Histomonas meleagridis]|uniref:PAP2 superfamily protein n=1 Tax=Histomonas meleagridis TaxID=135588 RepID=UPI00355A22EA|nr:PAP2 superfamily protein [Histomonas meleagridis]KAH0802753.1 PAP2 superfamily protein [Histomonas meleagridis]